MIKLLEFVLQNPDKYEEAIVYSKKALELRILLWDGILDTLNKSISG